MHALLGQLWCMKGVPKQVILYNWTLRIQHVGIAQEPLRGALVLAARANKGATYCAGDVVLCVS